MIATRRQLLAATGLVAVGGLSGCLGRAATAATTTGASPAAPFAGIDEYTGPSPAGDPTVYKLTPRISADSGPVSGDVELEAWVTGQAIAANHDNDRSNESKVRGPGDLDSDGDGIDDTVETRTRTLELERRLLSQTKAAADSISKRSARTGRSQIAEMGDTIRGVQETLERCSDDVCTTVREHADGRVKLTQRAAADVENGEWDDAAESLQEVEKIVEGDIDSLESSLKGARQSLGNPRLQELTGATDEDVDALYEYLAGEPVISEQFTITVPDARLPGGEYALVDELTPRHLVEYVTGRADDDGKVYAWGKNERAESSGGDSSNPLYEGDAVDGENVLYSGLMSDEGGPLHSSDVFVSAVSGPVDTGIHLESRTASGTVSVRPINDPPKATAAMPAIAVSADGDSVVAADFDDWGAERGESATTSTLVCPLLVVPSDCPSPFPALLYVRRCKHDDQYIFTGGWVIDDGSLYENSVTGLSIDGPATVIGVGEGDLDGDGYADLVTSRLDESGGRRTHRRRGQRLFDGTVADALDEGVVPDTDVDCDDDDCWIAPGEAAEDGGDEGSRDGTWFICHVNHLSAPIGHFTESNASDSVKFKAGAELSKSVN